MKRFDTIFTVAFGLVVVLIIAAVISGFYFAVFAPQEGYVTYKSYSPASYSNVGTAHVIPERFTLTIEATDDEGNATYNVIYVDSVTFHEVELHDFFSKKCMCVVKR